MTRQYESSRPPVVQHRAADFDGGTADTGFLPDGH